ncbi:MAG: hypothetical protein NUV97_00645 [archaeon]|nr:hypothetical protein [archaeon]
MKETWKDHFDDEDLSNPEFTQINVYHETLMSQLNKALMEYPVNSSIMKSDMILQKESFIVKWTVVEVLPAACQDIHPQNEYGITNYSGTVCAVLHLRTEKTENQKKFNSEEEADEFIKNMPLQIPSQVMGMYCENPIKIRITEDTKKLSTERLKDESDNEKKI